MVVVLLTIAALPAIAGPNPKPSREPLPAREVERGILLPKGWTEVLVDVARERADPVAIVAVGADEPIARDAAYTRTTERVTLRHGLARGHEVWLALPWHQVAVDPDDGHTIAASGFGDAAFGWRIGLLRHEPPSRALAVEIGWRSASARGGDAPLGAGTPALEVALVGRAELGAVAVAVRGAAIERWPAIAAEVGRLDPGDLVVADADVMLQAGPLLLGARPVVAHRGEARIADEEVDGSEGLSVDAHARLVLALTRAVEVGVTHAWPIVAEELALAWVDEASPAFGPTWGGTLAVRF